jgi:hypothetical protein
MDAALSQLPKSKRKALERAIFLKPSVTSDKGFKLMFLRADCYDATKAAARMAKFYEKKLSLFGEEKLVKKITSEDLNEEELARLGVAGCTIDVEKDPIGRPIWFYDASKQNFDDMDSNAMDSMVRHHFVLGLSTATLPFCLNFSSPAIATTMYCPCNTAVSLFLA